MLAQRLSKTDFFQQQQKIEALKQQLQVDEAAIKENEAQVVRAKAKVAELEDQRKNFNKVSPEDCILSCFFILSPCV